MPVIKAQRIPTKEVSTDDVIALFCFHYPQYTFQQARVLPYKRIRQMLKVAEKERARSLYDLTQIIASQHTKKGQGIKKMLEYFKGIINN